MSSSAGESGQGPGEDVANAAGRKSDLDPGTLVSGIYRLVRLVGIGGMGEVWEARHERTKGRVALKLLLPEMGRHEDVLLRFQREVEITSGLNHPNIVRVSDADKLPNGRPFLVMEFLDGQDLATLTGRPIAFDDVAEIIEQTAMGLHAAHGQSIIHRDLKPANIFVVPLPGRSRPLIKILDFGISKALDGLSKLTQTHSVMGTPYYMAPEQARGGISSMDARADQFSLAAIAYELLTGKMPFAGDGTLNVLYKVVLEQPPPFVSWGISLASEVEAVVLRGMSKSADERFGSVLEFSDALRAAGGAREEAGANGGGSGPTLPSGPAAEASLSGFAAAGGTLAVPRAAPPTPGRAGTAVALVTPRTLRMPGNPETTLRGSSGELAVADLDSDAARNDAAASPGGPKMSRRRTIGLTIGGAGVAAIIVAVAVLRGAPGRPNRVDPEPASLRVTTLSVQRPVTPSPAATPTEQVPVASSQPVALPEPVAVSRKVAGSPEPSVAPLPAPTPPRPSSSREKSIGARTVTRVAAPLAAPRPSKGPGSAKSTISPPTRTGASPVWRDPFADDATPRPASSPAPDTGKTKRTSKETAPDAPAERPTAKPPVGKTARQPGPLNSDL